MIDAALPPARTIGGWPAGRVIVAALLLLTFIWGAWVTRTLIEIDRRRLTMVSVNELVRGFVARESRRNGSPEESASRTRSYLRAMERVLGSLEREGRVILVRESVLGKGVPDETPRVRAIVDRTMDEQDTP